MKKTYLYAVRCLLLISVGLFSTATASTVHPFFLNERPCIALSNVRFYNDSSFIHPTEVTFEKGTLFQVVGETYVEHDDNAQEQTFKWYRLRTLKGLTGWIQGDAIAVITPEQRIDSTLRFLHRRQVMFNSGFEKSVCWVASVEGHDKVSEKKYLNPAYRETFVVITNDQMRSVYINCGRMGTTGKTIVKNMRLQDVTGDNIPDFTLILGESNTSGPLETKELEIYAFQAGNLTRVFYEPMTLLFSDSTISPAVSKTIDINKGIIRVAYADYITCAGQVSGNNIRSDDRCITYTTYTLIWDKLKNNFRTMYPETKVPLTAYCKQYLSLQENPAPVSRSAGYVLPEQPLSVLRHTEYHTTEKGMPKVYYFLEVRTPSGKTGFLPADSLDITDIENARVLKAFYNLAPASKQNWNYTADFILIGGSAVRD